MAGTMWTVRYLDGEVGEVCAASYSLEDGWFVFNGPSMERIRADIVRSVWANGRASSEALA